MFGVCEANGGMIDQDQARDHAASPCRLRRSFQVAWGASGSESWFVTRINQSSMCIYSNRTPVSACHQICWVPMSLATVSDADPGASPGGGYLGGGGARAKGLGR